ncbi:TolC family protein [Mucilaginibacter sp. dw_454]|uniref:TolC family protein n=1 Tax=Mucilaginibacter sp. dw_454 TaxID=2720079 RepID=UPI002103032A|nr:TolC family protein [Mucilaginibacter sp. dw_454]
MRKSIKRLLLAAVVLLASEVARAQQMVTDSVLTLQQCLDIGIKNNLQVRQTEAQMEASRIYWQQARENLLPTINGSIDHSLSEGRSLNPFTNGYLNQSITSANYNLSGGLVLSSGLTLQNSIRQTALAYQAGQMDFEQAKNDLTLKLITAYLQVLSSEDQLTQANTQELTTQKQEERTELLNKDGAVPPSQLYDLRGQLANDQIGVISAQNTLTVARLDLLQIMNVNYRKDIRFQRQAIDASPTVYNQTADDVYNISFNNFALIKAGILRRQSAEKNVAVAKGYLLPTLSLSGGLSTNYSSAAQRSLFVDSAVVPTNQFIQTPSGRQSVYTVQQNYANQNISYGDQFRSNYSTVVSLGLNIPILNYFQNRNKIKLAKIDLQTQRYNEQTNQVQLRVNVDQAFANMTAAYDRYQLLVKQVDAYTESYRIAEIRFDAGAITSVDFIIVKGNLDRAKVSLINARYDYLVRTKILDYYQGKLSLQ